MFLKSPLLVYQNFCDRCLKLNFSPFNVSQARVTCIFKTALLQSCSSNIKWCIWIWIVQMIQISAAASRFKLLTCGWLALQKEIKMRLNCKVLSTPFLLVKRYKDFKKYLFVGKRAGFCLPYFADAYNKLTSLISQQEVIRFSFWCWRYPPNPLSLKWQLDFGFPASDIAAIVCLDISCLHLEKIKFQLFRNECTC